MPKKRDDDANYGADAFLLVPDKNKASTWMFRYKEAVGGAVKVTREQLGRAYLAISNNGGGLSEKATRSIKKRLYSLYRTLGISPDIIPPDLREQTNNGALITEEHRISDLSELPLYADIEEATAQIDEETGLLKGVAMLGPVSKNRRRYRPEVMKKAVTDGIYESLPCYIDHCPDKTSGRRVKDLAGIWTNVHYDEATNRVRGDLRTLDQHRDILMDIAKNGPTLAAPSHVVEGRTKKIKEKGKVIEDVLSITHGHSVDIVTGGATVASLTENAEEKTMADLETITLDQFKTLRPELFTESITANNGDEKLMEAAQKQIDKLKEKVETLENEKADLENEKAEALGKSALADSQKALHEALEASPLPDVAKAELKEWHKEDVLTEEQIKTIIESQEGYLEKVLGKKLTKDPVDLPEYNKKKTTEKKPVNMLKEGFLKKAGINTDKKEETK
jgi:hypothetical protein